MRPAWLENWLSRNTPPCNEAIRSLSDAMERPLPFRRRIALRLHFLICVWCRRYHEQIGLIRTRLRGTEPELPDNPDARLPDEARERLKRLTRQDHS
jgi:hypothetical protein